MAVTLVPVSMTENSYTAAYTTLGGSTSHNLRLFGATGEVGPTGMEVYNLTSAVDCSGEKIGFFVNYAATAGGTIAFSVSAGGYWQAGVGAISTPLTTAITAAVIGPFESARVKSTSANKIVITPVTTCTIGAGLVQIISFKMP